MCTPLRSDRFGASELVSGDGHVLVFNAGSSSLKIELYARQPTPRSCWRGVIRGIGRREAMLRFDGAEPERVAATLTHAVASDLVLERLLGGAFDRAIEPRFTAQSIAVTGHRVVHGGDAFSAPVRITRTVVDELRALAELAPLHNPPALEVIDVAGKRLPGVPMVAMFDTAFFHDLPEHVTAYAIPASWSEREAIRRYGFHGIAHEYMCRRLAETSSAPAPRRVVSLHLGQGCSAAAIHDGRPVETSMGFTPLEGLIMGTRPGDLDAGVLLHMARRGSSWQDIEHALNRESGLRGLSGESADMREIIALEAEGHAGATLALAAFCHRIQKYVGAYAVVLGGVDALTFGGGIGENVPEVRERVCRALAWLGLELDARANADTIGADRRISKPSSAIDAYVIAVKEEALIAEAAVATTSD